MGLGVWSWMLSAALACPAAQRMPSLTIDDVQQPAVPVEDRWQVYLDTTPMSDMQLATLAGDDMLMESLRSEMATRGTFTYAGMITAAVGTAASSVGWALLGGIEQNRLSQTTSLSLALGGLVVGLAGVLLVSDSLQTPLQPMLAPTPRHRLTRDEVRHLITVVNQRWYNDICGGEAALH